MYFYGIMYYLYNNIKNKKGDNDAKRNNYRIFAFVKKR